MMATAFAMPGNNVSTTVGTSGYTAGAGSLVLVSGGGAKFPSLPSPNTYNWYYRVTVCQVAFAYSPTATNNNYTVYKATGLSGDTLTGLTVSTTEPDTQTDRNYSVGDVVEVRVTAGTLKDVQTAINTLEASGGGGGVTIGNTVSGGTNNSVLYVDGSGHVADSGPTWDGTKFTAGEVNAEGPSSGSVPALTVTSNSTVSGQASLALFNGHDVFTFNPFDSQGVLMVLSNNAATNRQIMFCASDDAGSSTKFGFRMTLGHSMPRFDGISTDGSAGGNITFGQPNNLIGMGGLGSSSYSQSDVHANLHVLAGSTSRVAMIVQAIASMTADIEQWQDSSGNVLSAVGPAGHVRTVVGAGAPSGTPATGSMYYDTTNHKIWVYDSGWKGVVVS